MAIETTPIPEAELGLFKQLKDLKIIFDVGARVDTDYLELWPDSEHHLFEPNPLFADELAKKVVDRTNVHVNRCGLGDINEDRKYYEPLQAFVGSGGCPADAQADLVLPIITLDWYVKEHGIKQIDFLKIDTEGHDRKVIVGAEKTLKNIRFLQYEHWGDGDNIAIRELLAANFEAYNVGYRNVFCMNFRLVKERERKALREYIKVKKLADFN